MKQWWLTKWLSQYQANHYVWRSTKLAPSNKKCCIRPSPPLLSLLLTPQSPSPSPAFWQKVYRDAQQSNLTDVWIVLVAIFPGLLVIDCCFLEVLVLLHDMTQVFICLAAWLAQQFDKILSPTEQHIIPWNVITIFQLNYRCTMAYALEN